MVKRCSPEPGKEEVDNETKTREVVKMAVFVSHEMMKHPMFEKELKEGGTSASILMGLTLGAERWLESLENNGEDL